MAEQKAARSKKAKRKDNRPARKRYTAERRWLRNKGHRMVRTLNRQPNNLALMARFKELCKLDPLAFRP